MGDSPNSETGTVEYTIRFSGDMWEHERFREVVSEQGAVIEEEEEV